MHHHLGPSEQPGRLRAPAEPAAPDDALLMTTAQRRLYRMLASSPGRIFTTAELARALNLTRRALDALALSLRDAIGDDTAATVLESVWGVGYRLTAPAAHPPSHAGAQPRTATRAAGQPAERRDPPGWRVDGEASS